MKNINIKLFIVFLAGILFSAITVFAATINVSTNFTSNAVQYLQKIVLTNSSNQTGIILDGSNSKIMSNNICDKDGNNCKIVSQLITGSALNSYLTGTSSFLTGENTKWCIMSGGKISCFENTPSGGGTSLWDLSGGNIYYNTGNVGIGTNDPQKKLHVAGESQFNGDITMSNDAGIRLTYGFLGYGSVGDKFGLISNDDDAIAAKFENKYYYGGRDSLVITDNGNVGIGTDSPVSLLHLSGVNDTGNIRFQNSGFIEAGTNPNQLFLGTNGKVGIGTNTPTQKFQVSNFAQIGSNVSCAENPSSGGYFLRLFVTEGDERICGGNGSLLSRNTKVNIQLNNYGTQDDDNWKIQNDKSFMSFGYATGSLVYENIFKINKDDSIQLQATTTGVCNSIYRGKIKIIDGSTNSFGDRLCFCGKNGQNDYRWLLPDGTLCNN